MATKKNIVVVGGGAAAVTSAKSLSDALNPAEFTIKLVTERSYLIHYPAMLRTVVTDQWPLSSQAFVPFDKVFKPGKAGEVVVGEVTSVADGSVTLADGSSLPYDYLVLATGTTWNGPLTFPVDAADRDKWIADWRAKFAKAKDVVILGGGACGIELSGELRHYHPDTKVTIIQDDAYLLNATYPEKFRKHATERVKAIGVDVELGDRASVPAEEGYTSVTTAKGKTIKADLVVPMTGAHFNTEFLESFDKTILSERKQVKVNSKLQVQLASGKGNVYAVGDIIDWKQQVQLAKVPAMAGIVSANIVAEATGKPAVSEYKGYMELVVLPLGPKLGMGYFPILWGLILGDWLVPLIKSKGLFVSMARGNLGY